MFGKGKSIASSEKVLGTLVRVLAEYDRDYLEEMLEILSRYYGEDAILSVVEVSTREILATTDQKTKLTAEAVVYSLPSLEERVSFIRNEKCPVTFRKGYYMVRVEPLKYRCRYRYCLVAEQTENKTAAGIDRCLDVLGIAAHTWNAESVSGDPLLDKKSLLKRNRVGFLAQQTNATKEWEDALGIGLIRLDFTGLFGGEYRQCVQLIKTSVEEIVGVSVFELERGFFAYYTNVDTYKRVDQMYAIFDRCIRSADMSLLGAVCEKDNDMRRILYLCESAVCSEPLEWGNVYLVEPEPVSGKKVLARDSGIRMEYSVHPEEANIEEEDVIDLGVFHFREVGGDEE